MTSRERVLAAIDGGEPDRVPVALGSSEVRPEPVLPPGMGADDAVDVRFVSLAHRDLDRFRRAALPFRPDTRLGTPEQARSYARWRYHPERGRGRNPLAGARTVRDISRLRFPSVERSPEALASLERAVADLHARGLAVGGNLPHLGGELFESAWRLRGLERFLLDLCDRPALAEALLDRLTALAAGNAAVLARSGIDVLCLGDDVGMPLTMMMSPEMWRRSLRPRMREVIDAARAAAPGLRVLYHSDGFIEPILGDLAEIGVNAVNPVQPDAMDVAAVRRRCGGTLALWGTVGSQNDFARAAPGTLRAEVARRLAEVGRAGLVLAPAYDIGDAEIASGNVAEFLLAARELGGAA